MVTVIFSKKWRRYYWKNDFDCQAESICPWDIGRRYLC